LQQPRMHIAIAVAASYVSFACDSTPSKLTPEASN
jgi:hypothetical protein